MTTGYTAPVSDGKATFSSFVWHCARAFLGDPDMAEAWEKEVTHIEEELENAKFRYAAEQIRSVEEWRLVREKAAKRAIEIMKEASESRAVIRGRYESMLREVVAWTPPTADHEPLRAFMAKQLRESIDFDCNESTYRDFGGPDMEEEIEDYITEHLSRSKENVARCEKRLREVAQRTAARREFIRELEKSVPRPR